MPQGTVRERCAVSGLEKSLQFLEPIDNISIPYQNVPLIKILRSFSLLLFQWPQVFSAPEIITSVENNVSRSLCQQLQPSLRLFYHNAQRMGKWNFNF
jgi:hypothetical protein